MTGFQHFYGHSSLLTLAKNKVGRGILYSAEVHSTSHYVALSYVVHHASSAHNAFPLPDSLSGFYAPFSRHLLQFRLLQSPASR